MHDSNRFSFAQYFAYLCLIAVHQCIYESVWLILNNQMGSLCVFIVHSMCWFCIGRFKTTKNRSEYQKQPTTYTAYIHVSDTFCKSTGVHTHTRIHTNTCHKNGFQRTLNTRNVKFVGWLSFYICVCSVVVVVFCFRIHSISFCMLSTQMCIWCVVFWMLCFFTAMANGRQNEVSG